MSKDCADRKARYKKGQTIRRKSTGNEMVIEKVDCGEYWWLSAGEESKQWDVKYTVRYIASGFIQELWESDMGDKYEVIKGAKQ